MARLFLAAMVGLACLTSGAFGQFMQQQVSGSRGERVFDGRHRASHCRVA